jgi:hypothetical protein
MKHGIVTPRTRSDTGVQDIQPRSANHSGDTTSVLYESHKILVRLFSLRSEFRLFALVHAAGLRYENMNSFRSATHAQYRLYYRLNRHTILLHLLTTAVSAAR